MQCIVQKFGGSSVADLQCLRRVAGIIQQTRSTGQPVVVVVSAMGDTTDVLCRLAQGLSDKPVQREWDSLLSTGEQVTASLLAIALNDIGLAARSLAGYHQPIRTTGPLGCAQISAVDTEDLMRLLEEGVVPVVAGFQGVNENGDIATLGRGGSDTTAVALARALNASECQIYSDVDGVFTSDPRVVSRARLLSEIGYDEMLELSRLGAQVLQHDAVCIARDANVPLRVLSSFHPGKGTRIRAYGAAEMTPSVSGIAFDAGQVKVTIGGLRSEAPLLSQIESSLCSRGEGMDMQIAYPARHDGTIDYAFTLPHPALDEAINDVASCVRDFPEVTVDVQRSLAKVSVVGVNMTAHASAAAQLLNSLSHANIPLYAIQSSPTKICALINEAQLVNAAEMLHTAFALDAPSIQARQACSS